MEREAHRHVIEPSGPRLAGVKTVLLCAAPAIVLFAYGVLSLILFESSPGFRDVVAASPDRFPWLADVFPVLRKVPQALAYRSSSFSFGYIHHLYLAALLVFFVTLAAHIVLFRSIQVGMFVRISSDARYRKRFDDAYDGLWKVALAVGFFGLILVMVSQGWLWSPTSRGRLYSWHLFTFPIIVWPMFFGALPAMILAGMQALVFFASREAHKLSWGVDAVREEVALNASGKNPDQF